MKKLLTILSFTVVLFSCNEIKSPNLGTLDFEGLEPADFQVLETEFGKWLAEDGVASIYVFPAIGQGKSIRIAGGEENVIEFEPADAALASKFYSFLLKRPSREEPKVRFERFRNEDWETVNGFENVDWNGSGQMMVNIPALQSPASKIRIVTTSSSGLLVDKVQFLSESQMVVDSVYAYQPITPALIGKEENPVLQISVEATGVINPQKVSSLTITTIGTTDINDIESVKVYFSGSDDRFSTKNQFGESRSAAESITFNGETELSNGINYFWVSYKLKDSAPLRNKVDANLLSVNFVDANNIKLASSTDVYGKRIGHALRQHGDQGVDTYRIPGLATTNEGTLIAVYDIRRNSSVDLQEDVDIGMNRSTDGGQTWEPIRVIMDMGEWGGKPQTENGIGDPAVLVDNQNNTIWVAAIWAHGHPGKRNWWASKPGLEPAETSQFVLVKSEDDGLTWSEPINITKQIKDPKWHLLLQGPGKGITLQDGTLVFPAQFKDENEVPHSTLISSRDHGKTWKVGTGLRKQTTEAQAVQLTDGSIMINARNNEARNQKGVGRVVAITNDLGKSWQEHSSSIGALEESTCMASLINEEFENQGKMLFFSNPNTHLGRFNMTIKMSRDEGLSWPEKHWLLLDEGKGRGYSCMTKIDEETIGILYEGSQADLVFEKVNISEVLK